MRIDNNIKKSFTQKKKAKNNQWQVPKSKYDLEMLKSIAVVFILAFILGLVFWWRSAEAFAPMIMPKQELINDSYPAGSTLGKFRINTSNGQVTCIWMNLAGYNTLSCVR